ncbi:MAG: hypothetical protein H6670_12965 [Anaerolineaceae bacterium]|nr:hypothetical protein [Anaerolineaceae bacterium]
MSATVKNNERTIALDKLMSGVMIGAVAAAIMSAIGMAAYSLARGTTPGDDSMLSVKILMWMGWFLVGTSIFAPVIGFVWGARPGFNWKAFVRLLVGYQLLWLVLYAIMYILRLTVGF